MCQILHGLSYSMAFHPNVHLNGKQLVGGNMTRRGTGGAFSGSQCGSVIPCAI